MTSQTLRTVDRAMQALLTIASGAPISVADLARQLDVPVSTTYRHVAALRKHGLVWELADQRLAAGPRCVQLENSFRQTFQQSSYREIMQQLARHTSETVALLVPHGHQAICIDTIESTQPLRYTFSKGVARSMCRGASAKAMLPWLDETQVSDLIATTTELDDEQRKRLLAELPVIREQGYATSLGEVDQGVWAVGAPVFKQGGVLDASLSLIAPHFRVQEQEQHLIRLTVEAANAMTNSNGWEHNYAG